MSKPVRRVPVRKNYKAISSKLRKTVARLRLTNRSLRAENATLQQMAQQEAQQVGRAMRDHRREAEFSRSLLFLLNTQEIHRAGFRPVVSPIDGKQYESIEDLAEHLADARIRFAGFRPRSTATMN